MDRWMDGMAVGLGLPLPGSSGRWRGRGRGEQNVDRGKIARGFPPEKKETRDVEPADMTEKTPNIFSFFSLTFPPLCLSALLKPKKKVVGKS